MEFKLSRESYFVRQMVREFEKENNMDSMFYKESAELQKNYQKLIDERKLTKKAMCDLCIPFRDKYGLTDLQTLRIARQEMDLSEMVALAELKGTEE